MAIRTVRAGSRIEELGYPYDPAGLSAQTPAPHHRHPLWHDRGAGAIAAFYADYGVPDTVEGRFDLIVLHFVLLLRRLGHEGDARPQPGKDSGSSFSTRFARISTPICAKWASAIWPCPNGCGDLREAFYGRQAAYLRRPRARRTGRPLEALARNIYAGTVSTTMRSGLRLMRGGVTRTRRRRTDGPAPRRGRFSQDPTPFANARTWKCLNARPEKRSRAMAACRSRSRKCRKPASTSRIRADAEARAAVAASRGLARIAAARSDIRCDAARRGRFACHRPGSATVGQNCVVTLEPLASEIEEEVDLSSRRRAAGQAASLR